MDDSKHDDMMTGNNPTDVDVLYRVHVCEEVHYSIVKKRQESGEDPHAKSTWYLWYSIVTGHNDYQAVGQATALGGPASSAEVPSKK